MTSVLPSPAQQVAPPPRVVRQRTAHDEILDAETVRGQMASAEVADGALTGHLVEIEFDDLDLDFSQLPEAPVSPAPATSDHQSTIELSDRQRDMLAFERTWWRRPGSKEQAIRERFQLSATRYYQLLNRLLDMPDALASDPITVARLRRLRAARARTRTRAA